MRAQVSGVSEEVVLERDQWISDLRRVNKDRERAGKNEKVMEAEMNLTPRPNFTLTPIKGENDKLMIN